MPDDTDARGASSLRCDDDLDEAYHEYLWGEASPRSFARKSKFGTKKSTSRYVVTIHEGVDASQVVPR